MPSEEGLRSEITFVLWVDMVGYSKLSMEEQVAADGHFRDALHSVPTYCEALAEERVITLDQGDGAALCFFGDPTLPPKVCVDLVSLSSSLPPLRMGMHCGPVVRLRDFAGQPNVRGVGINVAQRVVDAARPGSAYLTSHYAEVLAGYAEWRGRIVSRGIHVVKHGLRLHLCELVPKAAKPYVPYGKPLARRVVPRAVAYSALGLLVLVSVLLGAGLFAAVAVPGPTTIINITPSSGRPTIAAPYPGTSTDRRDRYQ